MINQKIRKKIVQAGLFQYQIADEIGINEVTFIRWLRKPLNPDKEHLILQAIDKLSNKQGSDNNG